MQRQTCIYLAIVACLSLPAPLPVSAQAVGPPTPPGTSPAEPGEAIREAMPVYYLRDEATGRLQPMPGWTLQDFERLMNGGATRPGQARPSYRMEKIAATGQAEGEFVRLAIEFTVFVDEPHWIRVPLRLAGAVIRGPAEYRGPGKHLLEFDAAAQEYVAWLNGAGDEPHRLKFEVLAPLEDISGRKRLRLSTPRSWASELVFVVPTPHAQAQASSGAILEAVEDLGDSTRLRVTGLSGDLSVTWWQTASGLVDAPTVLEAEGAVSSRIDGRSIHTETTLNVRSLGGEFDRFRVRLPADATLLTSDQPDYSVTLLSASGASGGDARPLVELRLRGPTAGPVAVRLVTEQTHDPSEPERLVDLGGFEVEDAVRQWGHVAVRVSGDWQIVWGSRRQVRQVEVEDLPTVLWTDGLLAGFEYFGQPYSLPLRVIPRETRITVEPEYLLLVGAQRVQLEATLHYRIGGAKVFSLDIDLPGWSVDEVRPANLVANDALVASRVTPLNIPLLQPSTGTFDIVVVAHRDIPPETTDLEVSLPGPHGNVVGAATVVVLPADNIELAPRESHLMGLARLRGKLPPLRLPSRQQPPLVYRTESPQAHFAAQFRVHARSINVNVRSKVTLDEAGGTVDQALAYHVARESLDRVYLDVPPELTQTGKLRVSLNGKELDWGELPDQENDPQRPARVRVTLPGDMIGRFELAVQYPLAEEKTVPQAGVTRRIPLVMPGEGRLALNELTIHYPAPIRLQHLDGLWSRVDEDALSTDEGRALRLTSSVARHEVVLGVQTAERRAQGQVYVQRAWLQTWLTREARQDRAVYQFTTDARQLQFKLPSGARLREAEVHVNGQQVVPTDGAEPGELVVLLPESQSAEAAGGSAARYLLELRYQFPDRNVAAKGNHLAIEPPQIGRKAAVAVDYWQYWQLVLPRDEHLIVGPAGLNAEYQWVWHGLYWGRRPVMDQTQLETWSGAAHMPPLPQATNQYLFASLGPTGSLDVRIAARPLLVLLASGAVLLVGLALIYVPFVRHPSVLLLAAVAVLALGAVHPEPALVVAQAGATGLLLALGAGLLERTISRREARRWPPRGRTSSIIQRESTQTHYQAPAPAPPSTTAAAGVSASLSSSEGSP